jgi:hypothetical protein
MGIKHANILGEPEVTPNNHAQNLLKILNMIKLKAMSWHQNFKKVKKKWKK